jgi:hypothetical protein
MSPAVRNEQVARVDRAIAELKGMILERYPTATFTLARGVDDPEEMHLETTVDVDDTEEVIDLVIDRILELQIEEGIPLHVIPLHTPERVAELLRAHSARGPRWAGRALLDP